MEFATLLLNLLVAGAGLATTGPGKAAFDALVDRLEQAHDVETLSLLPRAAADAGVRQSILSELVDPDIPADAAVTTQAEILRAELETLPLAAVRRYGLGSETLRAGRGIIAAVIESGVGRSWGADDAETPPRDA